MQIEFRDVSLCFGRNEPRQSKAIKKTVAFNYRFSPPGRILISGSSGTGKTTLLSLLYGLPKAYLTTSVQGSILFDGKEIRDLSPRHWSQLRQQIFTVLFQELRLFGELDGLENIRIKACQHPIGQKQRVERIVAYLGIEGLLARKPVAMSLGEQQRIALARALSVPFRWLLLDEPFSHLDNDNAQKASSLIQELCRENQAGFFIANHDKAIPLELDEEIPL